MLYGDRQKYTYCGKKLSIEVSNQYDVNPKLLV